MPENTTPIYMPTITLGNLLTLLVMIISGSVAYGELRSADRANAMRIEANEAAFDQAMVETRRIRPEFEARLRMLENNQSRGDARYEALQASIGE